PLLVFEDCDLDATVPQLVAAIATFAGEFCMAGTRVLVAAPLADELRRRLPEAIAAHATTYARTLLRGGPIEQGTLAAGAFFRPALFEIEDITTPLVQQE